MPVSGKANASRRGVVASSRGVRPRVWMLLVPLFISSHSNAQQVEIFHNFISSGVPRGGLLQASDGRLYGTTSAGGALGRGSIFVMTPDGQGGWTLSTLHSFNDADGSVPLAALIQGKDGKFYGTTFFSGPKGNGTVFSIDATGVLTTLHAFSGSDGQYCQTPLIQTADGSLYGTTSTGGANGLGTAFKIDPAGNFRTLVSFGSQIGSYPNALIQTPDGRMYGTCRSGGDFGFGTIFRMEPLAGIVTKIHSFGPSEGHNPFAGLILGTDGKFYGTTQSGGPKDVGTVFTMDPSGKVTTLYSFAGGQFDAAQPYAPLIQASDGFFYGTTQQGGLNNGGVIFRIDSSGVIKLVRNLSDVDGTQPWAPLIQATDGKLYGVASFGGTAPINRFGYGTVFSIDSADVFTTVYSFWGPDGGNPYGGVIQARTGKFYGTTQVGGANSVGTVFVLDSSGATTTLHSFSGLDGSYPFSGLLQASDGTFYGMTGFGGAYGLGTVFHLDPSGALTTLHSFSGSDGKYPYSALLESREGDFYGLTDDGGANPRGGGTIFRINSSGTLTTVYSFSGPDGSLPRGLVQAKDGFFYGTTYEGGAAGMGIVFKLEASSGALTTLHSFSGPDGANPNAPLIEVGNSVFYGTTYHGGANDQGTIFRIDSSGTLTTLHFFATSDGANPLGALIHASDGNFYGTTSGGGADGSGTLFRMDSTAALTTLHSFAASEDGRVPYVPPVEASDGYLYGTAPYGGTSVLYGVVYRFKCDSCIQPSCKRCPVEVPFR